MSFCKLLSSCFYNYNIQFFLFILHFLGLFGVPQMKYAHLYTHTHMHTHKLVQTSIVTVFFYLHFSIWWFGLVLGPPCPPTHSIIEQSRRHWNLDVTLSKSETGWKRSCARAVLQSGLWMQSNYRQCSSALISHPVCSLPVGYLEESQLIFFTGTPISWSARIASELDFLAF